MNPRRTLVSAVAAITLPAGLAACSSDSDSSSSASSASSATVAIDTTSAADSTAAADTAAAVTKVSANTATTAELVAALESAGVSNAQRWAAEIEEYRPYDTSDPTLAHLADELEKYNPGEETLSAILSVLEP